ncbi:hypothetical protein GMLC_13210 [Geomonas limicola]|uniref:Uncharacterized protein n=1 Tax=Geomonas limicola TaxID=2740186 RepID=A0A6V8N597_9BACT|nr:hypothetical protein GMLC_13210 [Geomonas limicola]
MPVLDALTIQLCQEPEPTGATVAGARVAHLVDREERLAIIPAALGTLAASLYSSF